ncbi:hypothetical protein A33Q_3087 [Indibacter alkaliphilus LW1]|jgi:hypothetical protein|uniref:Uncharacterized protein n=1 Tax=Indibacter alkaliphilus (strain CCUG 57479 / KCTC 22604 / LW1) TaxID=1189612 RepID=S2DFA1_INDAL|nr:hypothetical protein [Indibacter alkaliphilus]EOZ95725.1 hypothetical protein A33Q_3087 [Indibacter alkaliphilus LW1]
MRSASFIILTLALFIFAGSISPTKSFAQEISEKFILLKKGKNQKTQIKFRVGESFSYKVKDFDFFLEDIIVDIQSDIIVLRENILRPEDILAVDIRHKDERNQTLKNISLLGMGGGVLFLSGFTFSSLIQEGNLSQLESSWPIPVALFGAGYAMSFLKYKTFKNRGRNKIQLVILYEDQIEIG